MQPISGYQWQRISGTAAGTTVIKASSTVLHSVVLGQNKTGTVSFYDHASGTSASSLMTNLDNTVGTQPTTVTFGLQCKNGLVAETGGTTDILVIYE